LIQEKPYLKAKVKELVEVKGLEKAGLQPEDIKEQNQDRVIQEN